MKPHIYLFLLIAICMILLTNSPYAEEEKWEVVLDEFRIDDIAIEGHHIWCATRGDGLIQYNITNGSITQFTVENGLSNNIVRCVAVDKKGIKWLGVALDIVSFNDTTLTVYTSENTGCSDGANKIAVDHDNTKWFISISGIYSFNDISFDFYQTGYVDDIFIDHENIKWFAVGDRIRFDNLEWTFYPSDESFHYLTVAVDFNKTQFFGGGFWGLRIINSDNYITHTDLFGRDFDFLSIQIDFNNSKWIGTDRSLIKYDDVEFTQVISFEEYDTYYYDITDIEIDEDGSIWFVAEGGVNNKGILAKYTPEDTTTHIEKELLPEEITLHQAHPNPFNPSTTISYEIPFDAEVRLVVYDILGREITVLQDGMMSAGVHSAVWNGRDSDGEPTGSGVYIYRLVTGESTAQGKMLLMR